MLTEMHHRQASLEASQKGNEMLQIHMWLRMLQIHMWLIQACKLTPWCIIANHTIA